MKEGQGLIKTLSGFKDLMTNFSKGGIGSVVGGLFGGGSKTGGEKKKGGFGLWLQSRDVEVTAAQEHKTFAQAGSLIGSVLDQIVDAVKSSIHSSGSSGELTTIDIKQIVDKIKGIFSNSGKSEHPEHPNHLQFHH